MIHSVSDEMDGEISHSESFHVTKKRKSTLIVGEEVTMQEKGEP